MATIAIGISPKAGGGYTCKVPISAISEGGVPPEEGDTVQYSVEGKVESVTGNTATVSIDTINGEPIGEESEESPEEEGAEPETGTPPGGGGAGGGRTPVAANGPASPGLGLGRAKIGGTLPGETLKGMGARLRKGARGRPMPF
jgi:hypothetical protein